MSVYGVEFDRLALRWACIENEHDQLHPDRNECGGVGGCSMMFVAVGLAQEMIDALGEWRRRDDAEDESGGDKPYIHGSRLGREHRSIRQHLIEDHGADPAEVAARSDGAVLGAHDGAHGRAWAYAADLPHPVGTGNKSQPMGAR